MEGQKPTYQESVIKGTGRLSRIDLINLKEVEKLNKQRVSKLLKTNRTNNIMASLLGAGVIGIYVFTMMSVKQETFLDDFVEPEKVYE